MQAILNKTFFHFFLGFVSIVAASLLLVFSVGVYHYTNTPDALSSRADARVSTPR
jgi:hypothetical protein